MRLMDDKSMSTNLASCLVLSMVLRRGALDGCGAEMLEVYSSLLPFFSWLDMRGYSHALPCTQALRSVMCLDKSLTILNVPPCIYNAE